MVKLEDVKVSKYEIGLTKLTGKTIKMEHTIECLEQQARQEADQELYDANWPNACHRCNAWGGANEYENQAPIGSGAYWPESIFEECDDCIGQGKCPRCGTELFEDAGEKYNALWDDWFSDSKPCPVCGWNWGVNAGDVRPDDFECYCWIADSNEDYKEEMG